MPARCGLRTVPHLPRLAAKDTGASFEIAMLDAIFAMKSYTIHRRTCSRDIIDLWHFLQQGKTLADILRVARPGQPVRQRQTCQSRAVRQRAAGSARRSVCTAGSGFDSETGLHRLCQSSKCAGNRARKTCNPTGSQEKRPV